MSQTVKLTLQNLSNRQIPKKEKMARRTPKKEKLVRRKNPNKGRSQNSKKRARRKSNLAKTTTRKAADLRKEIKNLKEKPPTGNE